MLGSASPLYLGDMGTLPRRVPLGARANTGWQVRESGGGGPPQQLGSCSWGTVSLPPAPAELSPIHLGQPRSPWSPRYGAAGPGVAQSRLGSIPALDPTPGVFQRFIFSTVCNSRPLTPAAEPGAGRDGGGGPLPHRTPGPWVVLQGAEPRAPPGCPPTALGLGSLMGVGVLPGPAAPARPGRVKLRLARPGRKGGTWGAADGKFSNPRASRAVMVA